MNEKKHFVVTGATSGIGEETALALAKTGAKVIIIGRTEAKCQAAIGRIKAKVADADLDYLLADFSSIKSTQAVAQAYLAKYDRLDILVNNAGAIFGKRAVSEDNQEMHIAVNHIGPFVLTTELEALLKQTAAATGEEVRIVNVNSDAHYSGMNWDDIQYAESYSAMKAYGQSKAMNVLFTHEMARRLDGSGVTVNALHPGVVGTNIFLGMGNNIIVRALSKIAGLFMLSPEQGAETSLYLAQSPEVTGVTGKYFTKSAEKKPLRETLDEANWSKMWSLTEEWLAEAK
ncbi:MAG: SDR family oxidoreductase [Anaerolineae bacterium]